MLRRPLDEARSGLDARRPALQMETQWHANTPMPTIMQIASLVNEIICLIDLACYAIFLHSHLCLLMFVVCACPSLLSPVLLPAPRGGGRRPPSPKTQN